ncbi:MAG: AtpZ/AtpI family protein [Nitrospinae bacterium]|nr:AtpZ/AtpI family protein [Nitrospinota bacterium]
MNKDKRPNYVEYTLLAGVGTQLAVSIFVGFGVGYWLDKWLGTRPVFMVVFLLLGVAAGFLNVYRTVRKGMNSGTGPDDRR